MVLCPWVKLSGAKMQAAWYAKVGASRQAAKKTYALAACRALAFSLEAGGLIGVSAMNRIAGSRRSLSYSSPRGLLICLLPTDFYHFLHIN
jgi:hypothetical protein